MGALHEDRYVFLIISRSVLSESEKFQTKFVEKIRTHISCSVTFFLIMQFMR